MSSVVAFFPYKEMSEFHHTKEKGGTSLAVRWLRHRASNTGGTAYIRKTKILHDARAAKKKRKKEREADVDKEGEVREEASGGTWHDEMDGTQVLTVCISGLELGPSRGPEAPPGALNTGGRALRPPTRRRSGPNQQGGWAAGAKARHKP